MFGLLDEFKQKLDGMLKMVVAGAIAAAAAVVAFFCLAVALFLWMQDAYGTLEAWLALAGLFVAVAAIAGTTLLTVRRQPAPRPVKPERREEPSKISRMLQEPAVLLTGLQLVRALGARNILPLVLLGAVAGGLLMGRNGHSDPEVDDPLRDQGVPAE